MTQGAAMTSCNDDELVARLRAWSNDPGDMMTLGDEPPIKLMQEAATRIEYLKEAEWRPIESAPNETTRIMIGRWVVGFNPPRDVWEERIAYWPNYDDRPTHWKPLPDPPSRRTSINGTR